MIKSKAFEETILSNVLEEIFHVRDTWLEDLKTNVNVNIVLVNT